MSKIYQYIVGLFLTYAIICMSSYVYAGTSFSSVIITQKIGPSALGSENQPILALKYNISSSNSGNATINSLGFTIEGIENISNYKIYFTKTETFSTNLLIPTSTEISGNNVILTLNSPQSNFESSFYIWLTFDISLAATEGAKIDALYNHLLSSYLKPPPAPSKPNPLGFRIVGNTFSIGNSSSSNFRTLKGAIDTLQNVNFLFDSTLTNIYYELVSSTVELNPILIKYKNAKTKVTFRPQESTSNITTSFNKSKTIFINLSGANNITFDGRAGSIGNSVDDIKWTIKNTTIFDASANISARSVFSLTTKCKNVSFEYLGIEGEVYKEGLVVINTNNSTSGSENITFSHCKIQDLSTGGSDDFPDRGIMTIGSGSAERNKNIIIDNCHFIDVFGSNSINSANIFLNYADNVTISNNSFYQKSESIFPDGIGINDFSFIYANIAENAIITSNYFGGNDKLAETGKYRCTLSGRFGAIFLLPFMTGNVEIKKNVIKNLDVTSYYDGTNFIGISMLGQANYVCGGSEIDKNIIGSLDSLNSIKLTNICSNSISNAEDFTAINSNSIGSGIISFNQIGGIVIDGTAAYSRSCIISAGAFSNNKTIISNNIIGGNLSNSIEIKQGINSNFKTIFGDNIKGIDVYNNVIQNISQNGNASFMGVYNNDGELKIIGNTIQNISFGGADTTVNYIFAAGKDTFDLINPAISPLVFNVKINSNLIKNITQKNVNNSTYKFSGIYINSNDSIECSNNIFGGETANNISLFGNNEQNAITIEGNSSQIICNGNTIQNLKIEENSSLTGFVGIKSTNDDLTCNNNIFNSITSNGEAKHYGILTDLTNKIDTISNISISHNSFSNWINTGSNSLKLISYINGGNLRGVKISSNSITNINSNGNGVSSIYGIYSYGGNINLCDSNLIQNINISGENADVLFGGIFVDSTNSNNTIYNNLITNINSTNTTSTQPSIISGIKLNNVSGSICNNNKITYLTQKISNGIIRGISLKGNITVFNNVILLTNSNLSKSIINTPVLIEGIYDNGKNIDGDLTNIYHNTIFIGGSENIGTSNSFAMHFAADGNSNLKLNILINKRESSGALKAKHYAVGRTSNLPLTTLISDYNYIEAIDNFGNWQGVDYSTFENWKLNSLQDNNSVSDLITLAPDGKVITSPFVGDNMNMNLSAIVATDFSGYPRASRPSAGAFEKQMAQILPVSLIYFESKIDDKQVVISWETASELNLDKFMIEKSLDGINFTPICQVKGKGDFISTTNYEVTDKNPYQGVNYYRLIEIDYNGTNTILATTWVNFNNSKNLIFVSNDDLEIHIQILSEFNELVKLSFYDINGQIIKNYSENVGKGNNSLTFKNNIFNSSGMYFVIIKSPNINFNKKIVIK